MLKTASTELLLPVLFFIDWGLPPVSGKALVDV